jgi:septal ring factor EnvC (AmiA/AmiB activator)
METIRKKLAVLKEEKEGAIERAEEEEQRRKEAEAKCEQVEQDLASQMNKVKLLESDLDQSEDRANDSTTKLKEAETRVEELERENKGQRKEMERMEGHSSPAVFVSLYISKQCTELANGGIYTYVVRPAFPWFSCELKLSTGSAANIFCCLSN